MTVNQVVFVVRLICLTYECELILPKAYLQKNDLLTLTDVNNEMKTFETLRLLYPFNEYSRASTCDDATQSIEADEIEKSGLIDRQTSHRIRPPS